MYSNSINNNPFLQVKLETSGFQLCHTCNDDLLTFHKFYLKVKSNQIIYRDTFENSKIKYESEHFESDYENYSIPEVETKLDSFDEAEEVKPETKCDLPERKERKRRNVKKKYSSNKTHLCTICGRSYSDPYYLKKHITQHGLPQKKNQKPSHLICDLCGLQKTDRNKMRSHIETVHLKLKDATCHICGADFHRTTISAHIKKMHRDDKRREKCEECGKYFLDLKQHKARNHNEQEAVFCHICKKPFKNRMLLSSHRFKRHPPDGKYDCRECDKKFTNPVGLKEHTAAHHAGVFLYNCEFCDYRGSYKKNLFDHWKRNHREYYDQRRQLFLSRHDTEVPPKIEQI